MQSRLKIFPQSAKKYISKNLLKKYFSPKCFSGHVGCSLNIPAENFQPKLQKMIFQGLKNL